MSFVKWIKWIIDDKPHKEYPGFHCGCCGAWVEEQFKVPEYKSQGEWWDTWGICDKCGECKELPNSLEV